MYNGVGVSTPRGTGTNGYVSTNLANLPKRRRFVKDSDWKQFQKQKPHVPQKPNQEILEHDKKRVTEIKVTEWAEKNGILDSDLPQEEIDSLLEKARKKFERELERTSKQNRQPSGRPTAERQLSTHELAALREERQKKIANAFGIDDSAYQEGDAFDLELQERKKVAWVKEKLDKEKENLKKERKKQREQRHLEREEKRKQKKRKRESTPSD